MEPWIRPAIGTALVFLLAPPWSQPAIEARPQAAGLHIVVVSGEDAVNIIQQKTAVAPVVEVRDRNDQPVAGALVRFAIRGGRATFGGARSLAVTTDMAGRAAAAGLTPTASGTVQIGVAAAFQGQTVAVTIVQTNVVTAAEAAAVSGGAGGAGGGGTAASTGAAGAGGGGGLSATTLGIIGGAAAGGAVVAAKTLGGEAGTAYTGQFAGDIPVIGPPPFCGFNQRVDSGTLVIRIEHIDASSVQGTATVDENSTTVYAPSCGLANLTGQFHAKIPTLTGNSTNLSFSVQNDNTFTAANGATGIRTWTLGFAGSFNGSEIVGVLTNTEANRSTGGPTITASGTTAFPVTLR